MYSHQLVQSSCEGRDFIVCYITIDPGRQYWLALARQHSGRSDQAGELTHYAANCSVDGVYNPRDPISEPAGPSTCTSAGNLWPHTG